MLNDETGLPPGPWELVKTYGVRPDLFDADGEAIAFALRPEIADLLLAAPQVAARCERLERENAELRESVERLSDDSLMTLEDELILARTALRELAAAVRARQALEPEIDMEPTPEEMLERGEAGRRIESALRHAEAIGRETSDG